MADYFPEHSRYEKTDNYLFYRLQPLSIEYKTDLVDHTIKTNVEATPIDVPMMFLAPMEMQDNINHTWEPHTNVMSRMKEIGALSEQEFKMGTTRSKVDTALVYSDTDRRQIELMVYLAYHGKGIEGEVLEPVRRLQRYSCPNLEQGGLTGLQVENPTVFNINTVTGTNEIVNVINILHAALVSVQPSWKGPYIKGVPTYCELSLSFRDINPLSKQSFDDEAAKLTVG